MRNWHTSRVSFFVAGITSLLALTACDGRNPFSDITGGTSATLSKKEESLISLAESSERNGDLKKTERLYREAISLSDGNISAHLALADFYFRHGKEQDAHAMLLLAEKNDKNNAMLNQALGKFYLHENKPAEALACYNRGLKRAPDNLAMLNGKGIALDSLSKHTQAMEVYERALLLSGEKKDSVLVKNNMALSRIMNGDYEKAIALLEPLAAEEDSAVIRQNLALAYGLSGDMEKAGEWAGKDLTPEKLHENIRFYRQYHDNRILKTATPMQKPVKTSP